MSIHASQWETNQPESRRFLPADEMSEMARLMAPIGAIYVPDSRGHFEIALPELPVYFEGLRIQLDTTEPEATTLLYPKDTFTEVLFIKDDIARIIHFKGRNPRESQFMTVLASGGHIKSVSKSMASWEPVTMAKIVGNDVSFYQSWDPNPRGFREHTVLFGRSYFYVPDDQTNSQLFGLKIFSR